MRSYDQDSFDTDHPGRRGRHHDRPRGRGPGFGGPAGFGFEAFAMGPGFGPARFARRGGRGPGRGRRGDVRNAILALLAEQPMNGYQLINEISERTNGLWSPSAGSVYPALGLLLDEGLIVDREIDGKRVHELTEAGRAYVAEHADEPPAIAASWTCVPRSPSWRWPCSRWPCRATRIRSSQHDRFWIAPGETSIGCWPAISPPRDGTARQRADRIGPPCVPDTAAVTRRPRRTPTASRRCTPGIGCPTAWPVKDYPRSGL